MCGGRVNAECIKISFKFLGRAIAILCQRERIKSDVAQLHIVGLDCLDPCAVEELMLNA
jgi:hypothetical protein